MSLESHTNWEIIEWESVWFPWKSESIGCTLYRQFW